MFVFYSCRGLVSVRLCVWGELRHWSLDKTLGLIGTPSHPPPPFCLHLHPDPLPHFYRNSSRRSRCYNNRPFWGSWNCPSILLHTDLSLPLFCLSILPTNTSATSIAFIHFRNSFQYYLIFYFELSFINLTSKLLMTSISKRVKYEPNLWVPTPSNSFPVTWAAEDSYRMLLFESFKNADVTRVILNNEQDF